MLWPDQLNEETCERGDNSEVQQKRPMSHKVP